MFTIKNVENLKKVSVGISAAEIDYNKLVDQEYRALYASVIIPMISIMLAPITIGTIVAVTLF